MRSLSTGHKVLAVSLWCIAGNLPEAPVEVGDTAVSAAISYLRDRHILRLHQFAGMPYSYLIEYPRKGLTSAAFKKLAERRLAHMDVFGNFFQADLSPVML